MLLEILMEPDFDSMSMAELWNYKNQHQVSIPSLGDLYTAESIRMDAAGKAWPKDDLHQLPAGRSSFTLVTGQFVTDFREALKALVLDPKSRQVFEALRQRIVAMPFQELVNFNHFRNLVGEQSLQELFDREDARVPMGPGRTETIQRNGCTMAFTPAYVNDLREAMVDAVDQKEKDFINERSS